MNDPNDDHKDLCLELIRGEDFPQATTPNEEFSIKASFGFDSYELKVPAETNVDLSHLETIAFNTTINKLADYKKNKSEKHQHVKVVVTRHHIHRNIQRFLGNCHIPIEYFVVRQENDECIVQMNLTQSRSKPSPILFFKCSLEEKQEADDYVNSEREFPSGEQGESSDTDDVVLVKVLISPMNNSANLSRHHRTKQAQVSPPHSLPAQVLPHNSQPCHVSPSDPQPEVVLSSDSEQSTSSQPPDFNIEMQNILENQIMRVEKENEKLKNAQKSEARENEELREELSKAEKNMYKKITDETKVKREMKEIKLENSKLRNEMEEMNKKQTKIEEELEAKKAEILGIVTKNQRTEMENQRTEMENQRLSDENDRMKKQKIFREMISKKLGGGRPRRNKSKPKESEEYEDDKELPWKKAKKQGQLTLHLPALTGHHSQKAKGEEASLGWERTMRGMKQTSLH